jgi:hypothetical protein
MRQGISRAIVLAALIGVCAAAVRVDPEPAAATPPPPKSTTRETDSGWPRQYPDGHIRLDLERFREQDLFQRPVATTQPTTRPTTTREVRLGRGRWEAVARVDARWTLVGEDVEEDAIGGRPATQPAWHRVRLRDSTGRALVLFQSGEYMPFREGAMLALPDWPGVTDREKPRIVRERWKTDLEAAEWASQITVEDYDQLRVEPEARMKYRYLNLWPLPWRFRVDRPDVVAFVGWKWVRSNRRNADPVVRNVAIVSVYDRATGDAVNTFGVSLAEPAGTLDEVADVALQLAATMERPANR